MDEIVMDISGHKWDNIFAQSKQEICKYLAKQRNIPKSYSELSISFFCETIVTMLGYELEFVKLLDHMGILQNGFMSQNLPNTKLRQTTYYKYISYTLLKKRITSFYDIGI